MIKQKRIQRGAILMKKLMLYIICLIILASLFIGCQPIQQGVPTDVSYVPIDEIKVEAEKSTPESPVESETEDLPMSIFEEETEKPEELLEETQEVTEDRGVGEEEAEETVDQQEPTELPLLPEVPEEIPLDELPDTEVLSEQPSLIAETEESADAISEQPVTEEKEIVIIVQETELVSLKPIASDPDADELKFTYTTPLNEKGEWRTTYGDNGEYTITITASDGELTSSRDALLIVNKKEEKPTIDGQTPKETVKEINENTELEFSIKATDLNNDPLTYSWKLDGEEVSTTEFFSYEADYNSAGAHTVKVDVSDGQSTVSVLWSLTVNNVNRAPSMKVIPDIAIRERETAVIRPEATDPDGDDITYLISDPIGDDGIWETTYDDAGIYTIKVSATDGNLEDSQEVKVTVINVNRPPVIKNIIQVE